MNLKYSQDNIVSSIVKQFRHGKATLRDKKLWEKVGCKLFFILAFIFSVQCITVTKKVIRVIKI